MNNTRWLRAARGRSATLIRLAIAGSLVVSGLALQPTGGSAAPSINGNGATLDGFLDLPSFPSPTMVTGQSAGLCATGLIRGNVYHDGPAREASPTGGGGCAAGPASVAVNYQYYDDQGFVFGCAMGTLVDQASGTTLAYFKWNRWGSDMVLAIGPGPYHTECIISKPDIDQSTGAGTGIFVPLNSDPTQLLDCLPTNAAAGPCPGPPTRVKITITITISF